MKKTFVTLLFICSFSIPLFGQLVISWNTSLPDHFMIDDLWKLTISKLNPGVEHALLKLRIETNNHTLVVELATSPFLLQQGMNDMRTIKSGARLKISYGNNAFSETLQQMGTLPMGKYIFCATITSLVPSSILGMTCEERQITGASPPFLISPYNQQDIPTTYPLLTWQGPVPMDESKTSYALVIVKMKEHQFPAQAIHNNMAIINQSELKEKFLNYNAMLPPLTTGESYAWKVDVFYDHQFWASTDAWQFNIALEPESPSESTSGSYNLINDLPRDGFYLSKGILRIAYDNRSNDKQFSYRIIQAGTKKKMDFNQPVALQHGINTIDLDLRNSGFREGTPYVLLVKDGNQNKYEVPFYYIIL